GEMIRKSLADGDCCYGILDGDTLASYGWYSKRPTMMTDDLRFHFDPDYVYMFKGFTLPAYRGKRLHAIGMARALAAYAELGSKGILSYVESNNFASLRSCRRMGYDDIGTIVISKLGGRHYSFETPRCRDYALRVDSVAAG
ncbi:MAG: Acetyltransferase family, partial [Myxococcaceae bacterium]|nr:Acetyltransferase family [Myxococcaceae bacterium]